MPKFICTGSRDNVVPHSTVVEGYLVTTSSNRKYIMITKNLYLPRYSFERGKTLPLEGTVWQWEEIRIELPGETSNLASPNWYEVEALCQFYDAVLLRDSICKELGYRASTLANRVKMGGWDKDLEKEFEFLLQTSRVLHGVYPEWFQMEDF